MVHIEDRPNWNEVARSVDSEEGTTSEVRVIALGFSAVREEASDCVS